MSCGHQSSTLKPPGFGSKVYKDECTLCFESETVQVCLACFDGSCLDHARLHYAKSGHPFYLRIIKSKIQGDTRPEKVQKLEIVDKEEFQYTMETVCGGCDFALVSRPELNAVVQGVTDAVSAKKQSEINAWQEESLKPCRHTHNLVQVANKLESKSLAHCSDCELSENLWLCLSCGNLGCGRPQYGGLGGNGHGMKHYEASHHPISVKMGSITPEGTADLFCYEDGEEILNPDLAAHLSTFGINLNSQQKTEKSIAELQLEQNLKFDFSMTTEDGKDLTPLFGSGLTGLKNLGNSCYLASVLQILFSIPEFIKRYAVEGHSMTCSEKPAECFQCQMSKLANGLISGKYSTPLLDNGVSRGQDGISPSMFKDLVGKGHSEFSTMRQQDAQEFLSHLLNLIEQKERVSGQDPSKVFGFSMEQKLQCSQCLHVGYRVDASSSIIVRVPRVEEGSSIPLIRLVEAYFQPDYREFMCSHDQAKTSASFVNRFVTFPNVLAITASRFVIGEGWVMEKLNSKIEVPEHLTLDWFRASARPSGETLFPDDPTPSAKPTVDGETLIQLMGMGFPETRSKRAIIKTGNAGAEVAMNWLFEHMEDPDIDDPLESSGSSASPNDIASLTDMGFTASQAKRALKETGNNMERAVDWLFSHAGDIEPEESSPAGTTAPKPIEIDTKPANYTLFGFISHKGTSAHCGHYVAYVKKEDGWVLFNDNKVVLIPDISSHLGQGYMYFYKR